MSETTPPAPSEPKKKKKRSGRRSKPEITVPWLTPADLHPTWDWQRIFGRGGPVELELGCGKGGWLLKAAPAKPDTNFLGVDYAGKFLRKAGQRLSREGVTNAALLYASHESFLGELPPESVDAFHIYFPDPWHKDRHAKKRWFLQPEMIQWMFAALKPGGSLKLRTDVPAYFDEMLTSLERFERGFYIGEPLLYGSPPNANWICTNYEERFLQEGLDCFAVSARKREKLLPAPAQKSGEGA
jgi:tRNA (guanine-N7-)-methyltransferase